MSSARVVTWHRHAAVSLETERTQAIVVPELGMLVAAFVVDGVDFVARPGGIGNVSRGHTTGVPLLYPWANRLARRNYRAAGTDVSLRGLELHTDGNGLPMHGTLLGQPDWDVQLTRGTLDGRLRFSDHPELLASFPFPHDLRVRVAIGAGRLRVRTTVEAHQGPVPVSFGWHPYWRVPGPRSDWTVSLPAADHVRLDRRGIPTGTRRPTPAATMLVSSRAFDDLYALGETRRISLIARRRLTLTLDEHYPYAQVYAPPDSPYCCLEPMTAPTNALVTGDHPVVRAGESFTAGFTVRVT